MAKDEILIVSRIRDKHADDMMQILEESGHQAIRLNTDNIPLETMMSFSFSANQQYWDGNIFLTEDSKSIDITKIRSIWWRRPSEYFNLPSELTEQEREFARGELNHVFNGLWALLDCYWVSRPEHIIRARWKLDQLQRAALLGFDVPRTLLTSNPDDVPPFYEVCKGKMIFKTLSDPFLGIPAIMEKHPDQPLPESFHETKTTLITEDELNNLESIRLVPCLFQEYVPKQVELRVTIIGDEVFAAEIDSQINEGTTIDVRGPGGLRIPHRKTSLPADIAAKCLKFMQSYQLNYSAMDFILTPDGRYVFIENNPNGQFMWVEKLVPELQMTQALASCLIRGSNS